VRTTIAGAALGALVIAGPAGAQTIPDAMQEAPVPSRFRVDHRLSRFHSDFAQNLTGVWAAPTMKPLVLGGLGAFAASRADAATVRYFDRHPMPRLGSTGAWLGTGTTVLGVTAGFLVAGQLAPGDRFQSATYDMSQAVLVNGIYTFALKNAVNRPRPHQGDRFSFPSGHTSNAFAVATVWARHYGLKGAVPAYTLAGLVGVSRLASGKHHLSDVVAGATLGYTVGRTVTRHLGTNPRRRLAIGADPGPSGDGVGVGVSLSF
jgi:membrane-associated phospholipid phosphatase